MGAKLDIRRAIRRPGGGLTMVELVVVVAIIGIMAAIAIPSFARMGLLWRNDLQASARELYTLLRAAKIYAGTYNVDTALVYTTYKPEGSTADNLRAAAVMYLHPGIKEFVPVPRLDQGTFRPLPGDTCLDPAAELFNGALPVLPGAEQVDAIPQNDTVQKQFQAHVFEPSGRLRRQGAERYTIDVGYSKDASLDERLVDPELGPGENNSNFRTIKIYIYRATGRVEIASE